MMPGKTQIKNTALFLALVYLFLSVFISVGAAKQGLHPMHHAGHARQHSTLFCHWMCAASNFVHSADQRVPAGVREPSFERPTLYAEPVLEHLSVFSFHIRPPPAFLA
jgi:hypothetical protein